MKIGVVIPTRDEAERLPATIAAVRAGGEAACIVVADCGSTDGTVDVAHAHSVNVIVGADLDSRARAMNAGATWIARCRPEVDVLWFLHADSRAPEGWPAVIAGVLAQPATDGGAFEFALALAEAPWWTRGQLRLIQMINRVRYRLTRSYYGDQGIFLRRRTFADAGGFADVALLEDVEMCGRLRGRLRLAPATVVTSPRRFVRHGPVRQVLADFLLVTVGRVGWRPRAVCAWYNREKE